MADEQNAATPLKYAAVASGGEHESLAGDSDVVIGTERRKKKFGPIKYFDGTTIKLSIVLVLISCFSASLFVFGVMTRSLALISEGFHTASDVVGYMVGIIAHNAAKHAESNEVYPFGMVRATVVGGLFNGCFLVTASIVLTVETISRFLQPEEVTNPLVVMYIGLAGIVINFAGMALLCGDSAAQSAHGHSHGGGHGHSHGGHGHSDCHKDKQPKGKKNWDLNMSAIIIHLFVDCASSLSIAASGAFIAFTQFSWRYTADSIASTFIIFLIFALSLPLIWRCLYILLLSNDGSGQSEAVKRKVLEVDRVYSIDHIELWRLNEAMMVCSIKIRTRAYLLEEEYNSMVAGVNKALGQAGVAYSTVEVAFGNEPANHPVIRGYGTEIPVTHAVN